MTQGLYCEHRWGAWIEGFGQQEEAEKKRFRHCSGLCKRVQYENEPEPQAMIGRIE